MNKIDLKKRNKTKGKKEKNIKLQKPGRTVKLGLDLTELKRLRENAMTKSIFDKLNA